MDSIRKGQLSKELLENPLLQETLKTIEDAIIALWSNSNDSKVREDAWFTLKGLQRFESTLKIAVENGDVDKALRDKDE